MCRGTCAFQVEYASDVQNAPDGDWVVYVRNSMRRADGLPSEFQKNALMTDVLSRLRRVS